jgi:uncharacterized protein YbaR (Trm112 family)
LGWTTLARRNRWPYAYCPEHRMRLDIITQRGHAASQDSTVSSPHLHLMCPKDQKTFPIQNNSFWKYQDHFKAALEAASLKDADIVDIDGYQVPIAKSRPPQEDSEYWVEARINDTKRGKQLVVYAAKRGTHDKAQIFVDLEHDKITFDQNNMHPNDVFMKLTGEFDSGKKVAMEQ